jgi:acetyl esterase
MPTVEHATIGVPLIEVAVDARDIVRAFRESGGISFPDRPLLEARAAYSEACRVNGLREDAELAVSDMEISGSDGVSFRLYRNMIHVDGHMSPVLVFIHGGGMGRG